MAAFYLQLLRANYLWDERYSQLEREFDDYQKGSAEAQRKASDYIFTLKDKVDSLQKEVAELKTQQSSYHSSGDERALATEQQLVAMRERLEQDLRDAQHQCRTVQMQMDSMQVCVCACIRTCVHVCVRVCVLCAC